MEAIRPYKSTYIYIYTYKYLYETFPTDILNHVIQIYSLVDDSVY